ESVPEKSILKCLNKIQKLAEDLETHETRLIAGKMVAFLFHLSIDEEPTFSTHVKGWLDILLNAYMVETQKHNTYGDILLAVFQRYPDRLVKYLPSLIEYGFNKDIGYPKKIDALQYISCFMRKDLKRSTDPKIQKLFLTAAKTLATDLHRLLDALQNKFAKEDKAQKHHLAKALQLLSNFAHFAPDLYKETLQKALPTSKVEELLVLLQPLKSAVQNEFEGLKFENFVKRLHQRLYQ
uniref:Uncharacterized protein n=1 Tax=Acrobeloides nanus TaxID=290746 RepID=A0A914D8D0_9BILA